MRDRRPLPLQVSGAIRELLSSTSLHPGDQLPTEAELAARFDVGRTTIREALKLLEQDGLIDVRHGRGRFMSALPTVSRPITMLESVTEMMTRLGFEVTNRVLSLREDGARDDEAAELQIEPGARVVRLERVRLHGGEPLIYSLDVLPADVIGVPIADVDWSGSLLDVLERQGLRVASASAQIRATKLPRAAARSMEVSGSSPWLLMIQTNLTDRGRPVIYSRDYHRGDSFTFHVIRKRPS